MTLADAIVEIQIALDQARVQLAAVTAERDRMREDIQYLTEALQKADDENCGCLGCVWPTHEEGKP